MIVETPKEKYDELFEKKFKGFCERAPIYLTFSVVYDELHVKDITKDQNYMFHMNRDLPVEEFIGSIRKYLKKYAYPRLTEETVTTVDPSVEDLLQATKENKSFDEAFASLSRVTEEINYVIDKVNIKKNQLVLERESNNEQYLYQLKMPVVMFLRKELNKDPKDAFLSLQQEGELLYKIERKS